MVFSTDSNLADLVPDILELGIVSFSDEHAKAQSDIERDLRVKWWPKKVRTLTNSSDYAEMDATKLTASQFTRCASYLVLARYALPQLTNWVDGDRFQAMIKFYDARFHEELDSIISDGVEYDSSGDDLITEYEKQPVGADRLDR
jgi:hypothetical protein